MADRTEIPDEAAEAGAVVLREWTGGAWPADAAVRSVLAAALPSLTAERDAEIQRLRAEVAQLRKLHDERDTIERAHRCTPTRTDEVDAVDRDLVYRLAAADQAWSAQFGDEQSSPDYIRYLAEHATALREIPAPAAREPRVWQSDADPEPVDRPTVRDAMGDIWTNDPNLYVTPDTQPMTWRRIAKKYGPLTEVLPVSTPGGES